jgi:hypothetical protein
MHDLSEQLREWSTSLAESVEPTDLDNIKASRASRTDAFATRRWLAVAASVVVIVAGIAAVATFGDDDSDPVTPATDPPASAPVPESTSTPSATEATVFGGTGNDVIELDTEAVGPQIVVATNTGPGNFTVHTLNAAQEEVAVVVDVVGPTTGRYFTTDDFRFLRIESQGDWTIETVPAALADIPLWVEGAYTGSGNDVVRYTGEPGLLSYSDADDPNIAVRSHGSDTGAMFVAVLAEGAWTLTIEPMPAPAPVNPEDRLEAWPAAPAAPAPGDDVPRFLPTMPITVAGTPVRAQADGGTAAAPVFTQVFADAARDVLITLQTQPNIIESTPVEFRRPLTIAGWDDAFATDEGVRVVASDPSGYVRLMGTGIDNDGAAEIIASMQRRRGGIPGWDLGPGSTGLVEINGAWNDSAGQRFITWFDGDRVVAEMLTSPAHTDLINQALAPAFDRVDVNGVDGWLNPDDGRRSIVWSPDGTNIVVLGVVDASIDLLDVASSVAALSAEEFEARTTTQFPAGIGDGCGSLFC